jgi:hypothetical protein
MKILNILTKPLCSQETKILIGYCIFGAIGLFTIFSIMVTDHTQASGDIVSAALAQLLITFAYTEYRVSSVKKELLRDVEEIKFALKVQEQAKNR